MVFDMISLTMHTVIIGGGFAGIKAALEISRYQLGRVTLISDRPYFLHHGSVYATATGRDPHESMIALDDIFASHPEITVIHDHLVSLDPDRKLAVGKHTSYHYDTLVLALGSETDYGGLHHVAEHTFSLRNIEQIKRLNEHLHDALVHDRHVDRNYVIVGGGMTGVELAGSLSHYVEQLSERYLNKKAKVRVTLVESADRLLPNSSKQASYHVARQLRKKGVTVLTKHKVSALDDEYVTINNKRVPTKTIIWTVGTRSNRFFAEHPQYFDVTSTGHVKVNPYLEAYRDIYVLGDNVDLPGSSTARTALDMGIFISDHLYRESTGKLHVPYRPSSAFTAIPIGDDWAYTECFGVYTTGRFAKYLRDKIVYANYRQIMPQSMVDAAMQAHSSQINSL